VKRKHDHESWADRQRRRPSAAERARYQQWLDERAASFDAAAKVLKIQHMMAMNVGKDKVPAPSPLWNGKQICVLIAIPMQEGVAAVWSPERGYESVKISERPDVARAFPEPAPIWDELVNITRRAFLPSAMVQIYRTHPVLQAIFNAAHPPA